jgi:uncharacterized protein (DUF433 family)
MLEWTQMENQRLLKFSATPVPVAITPEGRALVGGTRIPLETVVFCFNEGATAEEIFQRYPALTLADIYAVLGFYLNHKTEVDEFLQNARLKGQATREALKTQSETAEIRARLLARTKQAG